MTRFNEKMTLLCGLLVVLAGCSTGTEEATSDTANDQEAVALSKTPPAVDYTPVGDVVTTAKPSGPITVAYRIIGEPVIGQPVSLDLEVRSALGSQPVTLAYRINDATAMQLAESQPQSLKLTAAGADVPMSQQVTLVPLREGRLFLNVSASVETDNGSVSTVTAIPIQVGDAPRQLEENGTVEQDADGNAIRVLPGQD